MGPRSQPGNSARRAVATGGFGSVGPASLSTAVGGRTFPGERHYRLSGSHKPVVKVARPRPGEARRGVGLPGDRGTSGPLPLASSVRSTLVDCPQCSGTACGRGSGQLGLARSGESVGSLSDPS